MTMQILDERFFKMSNATFSYKLKPIEFAVYSYLRCCTGNKEKCWPSMKKIAANCNCSVNAARNAVQELARRRFISCSHTYMELAGRNRQTNNTYRILPLPPLPEQQKQEVTYSEAQKEVNA